MLPKEVEVMHSGWVKLIGHTRLAFTNWRNYYREFGGDSVLEARCKKYILRIWGKKEDMPCHQLRKR